MYTLDAILADSIAAETDPLEGEMPSPRSLRRRAKRRCLRGLQRETLKELLPDPPAPGESVHIVSNGKYDFATWIPQIIDWSGRADFLYCSTWTLARPNAEEIFAEHDAGRIAREQLHFLTGLYFKRRDTATYSFLLQGLTERGGRFKAFENHCKVLLLVNAKRNLHITVEGSANLNANPRFEQYVLTNDPALVAFHRGWMEEVYTNTKLGDYRKRGHRAAQAGFSHRRAGIGTTTVSNDPRTRKAIIRAKAADEIDTDQLDRYAADLADLVKRWLPTPPTGCCITCPPQGASWPRVDLAAELARRVAVRLGLPFRPTLARTDRKTRHHPAAALAQSPFVLAEKKPPPAAIVIDDLITSGATMKTATETLSAAGCACWGFALAGC